MHTDRLYYSDCYQTNFDAKVVDRSENGCRIYLDRTAFYPTSGGQPHDLGLLGGERVLDVIDEDERIAHLIAAPLQGDFVQCQIDWARRYDHMQQHTGQHLLSAVLVELYGFQTLSFHMGADVSTIELQAKRLTDSQIDEAEERANTIAREARPVHIHMEESRDARDLRKPSERTGTLRIVEIEGLDRSACGGTHVRSTAEIGPVQIRRLEKIRGNIRVEFVCAMRAARRAKEDFRIVSEAAKLGGIATDDLPEYLASLRERLTAADKDRQKLVLELARLEADALYESTVPGADGIRRVLLHAPAIDEAVRAKVQAFTRCGKAVALVIGTEPPGVLVAASPDAGVNAGAVLKEALSKFGTKGGGSATLAQGSLPDLEAGYSLAETLGCKTPLNAGSSSASTPS